MNFEKVKVIHHADGLTAFHTPRRSAIGVHPSTCDYCEKAAPCLIMEGRTPVVCLDCISLAFQIHREGFGYNPPRELPGFPSAAVPPDQPI